MCKSRPSGGTARTQLRADPRHPYRVAPWRHQRVSELVALCLQLGASVSRLARECGVNANQVSRWLREQASDGRARKAATGAVSMPSAFVAVSVPPAPEIAARSGNSVVAVVDLQARLPNGVAIDLRGVGAWSAR